MKVSTTNYIALISTLIIVIFSIAGCASKGLLTERHDPDYFRVPALLQPGEHGFNPTFLVYGDVQQDWRIRDKFLHPKNYLTWKMAIFPFYEIYWVGNGIIGAVNWVRRTPDAGANTRSLMRTAMYERAINEPVDFILNTGDIVGPDGRLPHNWQVFLDENRHEHPLLNDIPYLPTVGNHERFNNVKFGRPNYEAVFDYPPFYSMQFPDMDMFVIDSDIIIDWKQDLDNELQDEMFRTWFVSDDPSNPGWLEKKLSESKKPFKVVSIHHCPVTFGKHFTDWIRPKFGNDITGKRDKLIRLFERQGVQLVLSGHDHIYQHNRLRFTDESGSASNIHFIVSSSGGMPPRSRRSDRAFRKIKAYYVNEGFDVDPVMQESVYHYTMVTVSPEEMVVCTYEVDSESAETVKVLEEIIIERPDE